MNPSIAIVVLNWNGKTLLQQFLPSVVAYSKEAKIYVADNASTDDSVSFIETHYPEITVIKNAENGGYAKGYNDALKHVNEDIYCLLNSDIEVTENWLTPILQTFSSTDSAIIQPKILDYNNKDTFEYAGAAGGFIDHYGYPFCRGRIFDTIEKDQQQYNDTSTIFWASGACFFITKSAFNTLGGFDDRFFAHMEEIDLCWRAYNLGYTTTYVGDSVVYHVGGATLKDTNAKKTYLNFRNSLFTLTKNASGNILFKVFIRLVLDGIAACRFISQFKLKHCFAILKAHFGFYKHLPYLLQQRKQLQQKQGYYKLKSIVWSYFISNKKHFNRL